jgi:dTDP-4-amino-4,6-dideoxygalactose transaminase
LPEHARQTCRVSQQLAQEVLSIPVYPELSTNQRDEVIAAVREFAAS